MLIVITVNVRRIRFRAFGPGFRFDRTLAAWPDVIRWIADYQLIVADRPFIDATTIKVRQGQSFYYDHDGQRRTA
jgi:hypothetical protein